MHGGYDHVRHLGVLDLASLRPAMGRRVADWARESLAAMSNIGEAQDTWRFCAEQRAVSGREAAKDVVHVAFGARPAGCSQAAAVNYLHVAMRHVCSTRKVGVLKVG